MPRSKKKAESHQRIIAAASRLFRERGFKETSVDDLMAEAGLTRGAFYAHFKDKSELLGAALRQSFAESRHSLFEGTVEELEGPEWLQEARVRYLSRRHVDEPARGCAAPALAAEVARLEDDGPRAAFTAEMRRIAEGIATRLGGPHMEAEAWRLLSEWAGALMLARAVDDGDLADLILDAVRDVDDRPDPVSGARAIGDDD